MNFVSSFNNNDIRSLLVQKRDDATFVRKNHSFNWDGKKEFQ